MQVTIGFRQGTRDALAIFQCITSTRRRLGAVGSHPPAPVRGTCQIDRVHMQERAFGRFYALTRPQKVVMAKYQFSGQQAIGNQRLRAVKVRQHRVEQPCTLGNTCRHVLPLIGRNDVRQQVQLPWAVRAFGVGVNVIGDTVFLDLPGQQGLALDQLRRGAALHVFVQTTPVRADDTVGIEHFVVSTLGQRVMVKQVGHGRLGRQRKDFRLVQSDVTSVCI
ncbi:hypothetical protein ALP68_00404 [Pseudomonas ficuserectae]|nr:hypothetical protein ALP68_00404 [Pseudomonas ficuserectae]